MADPVVIVEKIIEIAITITDAVETVRENKEECRGIEKLVRRVSDMLSLLKESEMMRHRVVGGPLEDLKDAIRHAHDVVTACQGKNILCLFCKAGKLAKKLSQIKNDISHKMMLAVFATNITIFIATQGQSSAFNLFFARKYQPPPLSEHLPSSPPPVVVEDLHPRLPTYESLSRSPDAIVDNDLLSSSPTQEPPSYAPVTVDLPNRGPRSYVYINPPPPPPPPLRTNVAPAMSKQQPRCPPKQPAPPSPPPRMISPSPPSPSLPTNVVSPVPQHKFSQSPTQSTSSTPSPPIETPSTPQTKHLLPYPSADLPSQSRSQSSIEVSAPVSGSVSSTASAGDVRDKSDDIKNKPAGREVPSPPLPGLIKFSLSELEDITNNFSNKIGTSDFATVYKGVLGNDLVVAIKEFRDPPQILVARLCTELLLASELQSKKLDASSTTTRKHLITGMGMDEDPLSGEIKNIIEVLGYGHELMMKDRRVELHIFLVEEYMLHGNMHRIIYGSQVDWPSRFRIIQGLAQGLHYLHEQNIVHMNVKPANILLDSDMNPKITDFGIAKKLDDTVIHDNNIAGTVGYMPPEYILEGILSTKHDVYSFGVIILETISGMCKADEPARHHSSVPWAWSVRNCQPMHELFDPSLLPEESQVTEIKRCLEIGLLCTQSERPARPAMKDVIAMLNGEKQLANPKQPEYTKERGTTAKGASHKARNRR